MFRYKKEATTLFEHLEQIRKRLIMDVKPYVDLVQIEALANHIGIGNFSLVRMLMPIVETVAKDMSIKPQELLKKLSVPNPYLSWSIFRDVFMHSDGLVYAAAVVNGEELIVNPGISISHPGTPAVHTTTSEYQLLNLIGLYESMVSFIDNVLSDKQNDKAIKIVVGIEYLDHDNIEIKMIEQEIKRIKRDR